MLVLHAFLCISTPLLDFELALTAKWDEGICLVTAPLDIKEKAVIKISVNYLHVLKKYICKPAHGGKLYIRTHQFHSWIFLSLPVRTAQCLQKLVSLTWTRKKTNVVFRARSKNSVLPRRQGEDVCPFIEGIKSWHPWAVTKSNMLKQNHFWMYYISRWNWLLQLFSFFHLLSSEGLYLSGKTFTLIPSTFQPALLVLQGINFWVLPTWNIWYCSLWCLRHGMIVLCHLRTFKISNFRFLSRHSYFSEIS